MTEHTPGPWTFDPENRGRTYDWHYGISLESGFSVAYVPEDHDADARLIAAAPELYEELREWTRGLQSIAEGLTPGRSLTPWEQERLSAAIDLIADVEGIR